MGGCQNDGPFVVGTQNGTIMLTTTRIGLGFRVALVVLEFGCEGSWFKASWPRRRDMGPGRFAVPACSPSQVTMKSHLLGS